MKQTAKVIIWVIFLLITGGTLIWVAAAYQGAEEAALLPFSDADEEAGDVLDLRLSPDLARMSEESQKAPTPMAIFFADAVSDG